ncbi:MAG TPA: hypothetical protein VLA56_18450 [Pseudomonadales bacterium]|nr:hypothetical protein [Pseudomonadales bacterium]
MKYLNPALLSCLFILGSCQSMSSGVLSLEARALVLDDVEIDSAQSGSSFDSDDVDIEGYGVHAALMTPIFDVLGGLERREFESEDAPELVVGLRRRFLEIWRFHPYVEGNLRYGFDLDNGVTEDDYFGWQVGVGTLFDLTDTLFLNVRLMHESTDVEQASGGSTDVDGLVGTIGIGLAL